MLEKILVLGAGEYQVSGIRKLIEKGYFVVALDGNEKAEGASEANEFHQIDIKDTAAVLQFVRLYNWDLIGCICFSTDVPLRTVGKVNEEFHLKGLGLKEVMISTDKSRQRLILEEMNLPIPDHYLIDPAYDIDDELSRVNVNFPCIIKPADGSGSRGVYLVNEEAELKEKILASKHHTQFDSGIMVEEFICGTEFTIESLITGDTIYTLGISEKKKPIGNFTVSTELYYNSPMVEKFSAEIEALVNPFLKACSFSNTITHTEVIYSFRDHKFYLVEASARSGGFNIFDKVLPAITNLDVIGLTIDAYLGREVDLTNIGRRSCILRFFTGNEGIIRHVNIDQKCIDELSETEYGLFLKEGDKVGPLKTDGSRLGYIITFADTWTEAFAKANLMDYSVRFEITPDEDH